MDIKKYENETMDCRDSPDLLQLGRDCFLTAKEQSDEAKTA